MSAGSGSAGDDAQGAGGDPMVVSTRFDPTKPVAIRYDPELRLYVLADNQLARMHPIDQAMAIACTVPLGSLPSSPETGIDFEALRQATWLDRVDVVNTCVANATLRLRQRGLVRNVVVRFRSATAMLFEIEYTNVVTGSKGAPIYGG